MNFIYCTVGEFSFVLSLCVLIWRKIS